MDREGKESFGFVAFSRTRRVSYSDKAHANFLSWRRYCGSRPASFTTRAHFFRSCAIMSRISAGV